MPTEVQVAMGQLAQMRAERAMRDAAAMPAPAFTPSAADLVALAAPSPSPAWASLTDRDKQSALDTLQRATGLPLAAVAPTTEIGFGAPLGGERRGTRTQLPLVAPEPAWGDKPPGTEAQLAKAAERLVGVMNDAFKAQLTAAAYLNWVRMAQYPWWWGPVSGGLEQVEALLANDLRVYQESWLPPETKQIAASNISQAMNWVREQRAASAARAGSAPVAH